MVLDALQFGWPLGSLPEPQSTEMKELVHVLCQLLCKTERVPKFFKSCS